jgi:hypothetical protein
MAGASSQTLPNNISITDEQGTRVQLASLTRGHVSVVAFWSRFCGISRLRLPLLAATRRALEGREIAFLPITTEAPGPDVRAFLRDHRIELTSYYDDHGQARRATYNISTPTYYVLDAAGRVRFQSHTPTLAITEAVALQQR